MAVRSRSALCMYSPHYHHYADYHHYDDGENTVRYLIIIVIIIKSEVCPIFIAIYRYTHFHIPQKQIKIAFTICRPLTLCCVMPHWDMSLLIWTKMYPIWRRVLPVIDKKDTKKNTEGTLPHYWSYLVENLNSPHVYILDILFISRKNTRPIIVQHIVAHET